LPARFIRLIRGEPLDRLAGLHLVVDHHDAATQRYLTGHGIEFSVTEGEIPDGGSLVLLEPSHLAETVRIIDRLLGPGGCPWDQKQTHETLRPHLVEETYEVVDAIDRGDPAGLREELGDLLLQPILHGQIAAKSGHFDAESIAEGLNQKLVRRHPHVFGTVTADTEAEVLANWDAIKAQEKGAVQKPPSLLDGIPRSMPSLSRADAVSRRAARQGFEWPDIDGVYDKLHEEIAELRAAVHPEDQAAELGDILFTVVNLARWLKVDPEAALTQMLNRFTDRYQAMAELTPGNLSDLTPEEWEALWQRAKAQMAQKAEA